MDSIFFCASCHSGAAKFKTRFPSSDKAKVLPRPGASSMNPRFVRGFIFLTIVLRSRPTCDICGAEPPEGDKKIVLGCSKPGAF